MSARRIRQNVRFLAVLAVIAAAGLLAAAYVLLHERLPDPLTATYNVQVQLSAADGVVPGYGQPVEVAGVPVGTIAGARVADGTAIITLALRRSELPRVYRDATAALEPVTPLKDMEMDLDPGHPSAGALPAGSTIGAANTTSPGELEDLLGSLDGDTRAFLSSLISSLGTGTAGQGTNLRRLLVALGPTASQLGEISTALAARRSDISRLVHNLAIVTRAASQDSELSSVVEAGDQTLHAVATQDAALGRSVAALPATLGSVQRALGDVSHLASVAGPSLAALTPVMKGLPATLHDLGPFARQTTTVLASRLRPLIRTAVPALANLAPAAAAGNELAPRLTGVLQILNYTLNELAYNPGNGDPGMLFWLDWAAHNVNSATGNEDAHGSIVRTLVLVSCQQLTDSLNLGGLLENALNLNGICKS